MAKDKIGEALGIVFMVYIAFILTKGFCDSTPDYCYYGWTVFGALVVGVVAYFKYRLFS